MSRAGWILPDWPSPAPVRSLLTTRHDGVSLPPYGSLNLADHVGDDPLAVVANRRRLAQRLPAPPCWLQQVHGTTVVDAALAIGAAAPAVADASFAREPGVVCVVLTADCLPVLLCDRAGSVVAAAHAGWRGLQAGILERTVAAMGVPATSLMAYLGPAIGAQAFEVGDEVRQAFIATDADAVRAFSRLANGDGTAADGAPGACRPRQSGSGRSGGWLADLYLLAQQRLSRLGVGSVHGGEHCTLRQQDLFFSYRRDGVTGRMASLIWLACERPSVASPEGSGV
ncbi:peptidoglycan editing factor PgeF [Accumulibacter sp.]|uniref:peptidoglycan editing factor PgeF n=1 Tax=Accumulibacter sp. TaxID=2053492 RepID=UPI0025E9255F|nr:peptidoglycan editing factor PgeF [Accumulibacter sp.]MCM8613179.1 peptidoglycan editing factor PgeF [Accumulibacter sp.]MCM8636534.1 peptidoglycan editing factor PgeF [Accumulibacter sp.]MCM8640232.1 peptidoglycan editing factor PgeF [Accumulibacter sp.]